MEINFSKKQLAEHFPEIEQKEINSVWLALNIINDLNKDHFDIWARKFLPGHLYTYRTPRIQSVMYFANKVLKCYGVEPINCQGSYINKYWQGTVALYLNSGDTYSSTIVADIEESEFHLTTFGDWIERNTIKEFEEV